MAVKKDADEQQQLAGEEGEYVRVETKSSRQRDSMRAGQS
jgi:hypothetical protein